MALLLWRLTNTQAVEPKPLFGGMATFLLNHDAARMESHGQDPRGLGCWTWAVITGRQGLQTCIINAYRPTHDTSDSAGTVFLQQELVLRSHGITSSPHAAFLANLGFHIQ